MKTMTCKELGGACEKEFHAETFDQMVVQSKKHGKEMAEKGDKAHLNAMKEMQSRMASPEILYAWFETRRRKFDHLPEDQV